MSGAAITKSISAKALKSKRGSGGCGRERRLFDATENTFRKAVEVGLKLTITGAWSR